jgi:NAD kinase
MKSFEKIVLVTRKTRLQELIERFNTEAQARFYIEHAGGDFSSYVDEHETYQRALDSARRSIDVGLKLQILERGFLPTYLFAHTDIIVTLGQDGLVANTAKYVHGQPILAVNPDPKRFDGILLPVSVTQLHRVLELALARKTKVHSITMAQATLKDGQRLLAFNDLFIGARSHISARYRIRYKEKSEDQSSSGIIVSTGAGSSGWISSVFNEVSAVCSFLGGKPTSPIQLNWEDQQLLFVVREPFLSRQSQAGIAAGMLSSSASLNIESQMPASGIIFSDGVEADGLDFNSGAIVTIGLASERANLVKVE